MTSFFFKTNELTDFINFISWPTNTKLPLLPHYFTATWHRGYGFFEVCQAEGHGFKSRPWQKFFCANFFSALWDFFFANISKGSTRHFFVYFAKNGCSKTPRVPPFTCFGTMRLTGNQKKSKKKLKIRIFFPNFSSSGYCRREYLTLWSPFAIFEP